MNILSLGEGFISEHLPYWIITDRLEVSSSSISNMLDKHKPDVLINCIGKTGRPNIDWCESHQEDTANINAALPILLATECNRRGIHLIQVGSGCVFFGPSPGSYYGMPSWAPHHHVEPGWKEDDWANPKSFYSKTKYACDLILNQLPNITTLRIRMPISTRDTPRNLINKLRGYRQIIDIPNSVTFMSDFVRCVAWAAENRITGPFHVVNPEPLTAVRIMREYQKYVPDHKFEVMTEEELDSQTAAKRSNCILSTQKLTEAGFQMTPTGPALIECMREYVGNIVA